AALVYMQTPFGQVAGYAEERQLQVADVALAEHALHQLRDLASAGHGHQRKGAVGHRVVFHEGHAQGVHQLRLVPAGSDARSDNGPGTATSDVINLVAVLAQRAQHSDVRESARAATG